MSQAIENFVDASNEIKAQLTKHFRRAQKRLIGSHSAMKINHLNLSVPDVPLTSRFFVEFFGLQLTEEKGGIQVEVSCPDRRSPDDQ